MNPNIPNNFLGIEEKFSAYKSAKFAILPVPYEHTVSFGGGTAKGPRAIIEASWQIEFFDEELGFEPLEAGIATLSPVDVAGLVPSAMSKVVESSVAKIIADGKLPVILGGEHSITLPIVKAVALAHNDVTVLQFDAHADLRQEYQGEPMNHACAMARVREICPAVQVGIRNLSKEEAEWAKREKFPIFYAHDMRRSDRWMDEALAAIKTNKVHVTIDVDAFDGSLLPATGTPEPGGMNWYQMTDFIKLVTSKKRVVGFDIVEHAPIEGMRAYDFMVAKLAYKCIGYW